MERDAPMAQESSSQPACPPASASDDAPISPSDRRQYRLLIYTSNDAKLTRYLEVSCLSQILDEIPAYTEPVTSAFHTSIASLSVSTVPPHKSSVLKPHPFKFTNICGKIKHTYSAQFHQPGVKPMVVRVQNGFGRFECLYSVHTNLLTGQNRNNTLFRGGRNSKAIISVIEHAFCEDSIGDIHVHMMVANIRMSHPVTVKCTFVDKMLTLAPQWKCLCVCMTEDQAYMKSFKIAKIKTTWQATMIKSELVDKDLAILVNVCRSGSINLFMSIGAFVPLTPDIEHEYTPILMFVVDLIHKYT